MDLPTTSSQSADEVQAARFHHRASRFRPILFRRATSATSSQTTTTGTDQDEDANFSNSAAAGQEAKDFYERLISETTQVVDNEERTPQKLLKRKKVSRKQPHERRQDESCKRPTDKQMAKLANNLLQGAQHGDLKKIKDALKQGCDINTVDDFKWTALMCACHSGQTEVVQYLLKKGASWVDHYDQKGRSALTLAKAAKHMDIYDLLMAYSHDELPMSTRSRTHRQEANGYSCKICKMDFTEMSKAEHLSSTVHLFNCQHKPQSTFYHIPEGNIGFKLLLKDGWDKEQGLGPEGKGAKFPVKTILKRDRQGLGANPDDPQSRPRVTHFQPHDVAAVKKPKKATTEKRMKASTLSKKKRHKEEIKERAWEIGFRQSFNTFD
ncbi:LOW QUALITY PROTEIN: G patch domain and ankyrin repeat-containing protein 1-like [Amphiura filiformis]|uniref:LOW QUALITY PROTEIN: G patch domain and ankyrin repeat-containing protein 1-like n=1 Tax=Amphiura filiformis TaxID=82378 RepID=UPI003B22308B